MVFGIQDFIILIHVYSETGASNPHSRMSEINRTLPPQGDFKINTIGKNNIFKKIILTQNYYTQKEAAHYVLPLSFSFSFILFYLSMSKKAWMPRGNFSMASSLTACAYCLISYWLWESVRCLIKWATDWRLAVQYHETYMP